jgi:hypothetical protein
LLLNIKPEASSFTLSLQCIDHLNDLMALN